MSDRKILVGSAVAALVIGVLIFAFTKIGSESETRSLPTASVVPFTSVAHGAQSGVDARVNYRITSEEQLRQLWKTLNVGDAIPAVDFTTHEVLAVFAGTEPVTTIAVAKIEDTNERMVSITLEKPSGACKKRPVALPYEIVVVPTTSLPLAHEDVITTVGCPK